MTKLTINVAAFAPFASRRSLAGAATFSAVFPQTLASAPPGRRGLHCGWTRDADGHLVCNWSDSASA
ncbi:MAG: hypothetical protein ACLP8A_06990 [Methylovirgula sp.]